MISADYFDFIRFNKKVILLYFLFLLFLSRTGASLGYVTMITMPINFRIFIKTSIQSIELNMISEAREKIILHLLQHNYLNEERYAKSFARGKFSIKKWGKRRIVNELKFKGISTYNINVALKEIDDKDYIQTLNKIAHKKIQLIKEF